MAQVLLHINDVELVLSRLYEVLNVGGHLLIADFNKNEEEIHYKKVIKRINGLLRSLKVKNNEKVL